MQSCKVFPPPPGALGVDSLRLVVVVRDEPPPAGGVASVGGVAKDDVPGVPEEEGGVSFEVEPGELTGGGDNGAMGATWSAGVLIAEGDLGAGADGAGAGALGAEV
jgi:hypothetical protein